VIVQTDVETKWNIHNVNVTGIPVVVAVSYAEGIFTAAYCGSIIDCEESGWTTFTATGAYGWRLIPRITLWP
jgi:hypothetical protein